jgi:hypothetical protein
VAELWSKALAWARRYLLAPLPALLVVVGAIILAVVFGKKVQIGGVLGKLFGHEGESTKAVDVANTVPDHRVDKDGKIIPIGTPDDKGLTQAVVVPIESPGIFSNPDTVVINHPDEKKPVVIALPEGVKSKDVDKVIVVKPEVYAVTVKESSPVAKTDVDDLLKKYGG